VAKSKTHKPCIGITKPERGDNFAYWAIKLAVTLCGGHPMKITTGMSWQDTDVQGLIIGGGADVFPAHYDQDAIEGAHYDQSRDEMEMYWARKARDRSIPTLAICRGAQVMNVASGGTLHQTLHKIYENVNYPDTVWGQAFFRKKVTLSEGSLIRRLIKTRETWVNSIHKQAIAEVGDDLTVTARESNGVVQAIEDPSKPFYIGVQFHPEFLTHRRRFRRLFERLVKEASIYGTA
jgi:putative glutamine amidotransferase